MKKQLVLFSTILLVSSILYGCGGQSSFNDESVSSTVSDSSEISSEDHIHTPGNAVEENRIEPTCTIDGSYDLVTYCSICHKEMLRQHFSISAPGHTPGEAVYENVINPTCVDKGSYDLVTYCLVCEEEVKRKHIEVDAKGHAPEEAKQENRIEPTCTTDGSYDSVIYCANCHEELNRTKIVLPAHGHTPEESVRENETAALCTTDGSYDLVTYCSTCHKEISREHKTTPALGHDLSEPKTYYLSDIDNQIYAEYECHRCHEYMTKELQQEEIVIELIQLDDGVNYKMIIDSTKYTTLTYQNFNTASTAYHLADYRNTIKEIRFGNHIVEINTSLYFPNVEKVSVSKNILKISQNASFSYFSYAKELVFEGKIPFITNGVLFNNSYNRYPIYYYEDNEYSSLIQIDGHPLIKVGAIIPDFPEYTLDEYYYQMMLKNVDLIQTFIEEDEANDASYLYMYPYSNSIKELREIEAFTNELVSSATDDLEITNAIFDYLRTNITYDSSASIFFPAETLKAKKGVCYQYATLMHDMLTTQGIISFEVNCYTRFGLPYENAKQAAACQEIASNRHMLLAVLLNNQILYYDPTWGTNYGTDYRNVSTQYYVYGVTDVTYKLDDIDLSYMLVDNIYAMPMWIKNEICTIYQGHYVGGGTSSSHNGVMIDNSKERNKNDGQYNYGIKDYGPLGYAYRSCVSIYQVMSGQVYRADGNYFSLDSFIQFAQYMGKSMDEIVGLIKEWIDIDYIDDYLISHFYGENYIFGYYGTESNLIIPSTIGDYPIKSIYPNSFNNNSYLETVTISEGIKNIFAGAFSNCDNLREVSFPSSATYIGGRDPVTGGMNYSQMIPCDNCFNLERFIVSENNQRYKSYNDCLYTKDGKTLMSVPCKKANIDLTGTETIDEYAFKNSSIKEIVVPSSVTNIRHRAFACAFDLESIVFDCDGAEMGVDVFAFCYKLEHVTLEGVNTIGAQDFYHCVLLKEIIIPEGVTTIGNEAFCGSGLYSITLPSTLETIGEDLFYACYQLVEINNHSSLDILSSAGLEEESLNRVTDPSGHIIKDNDFVFYKSDTVCELIAYLGEDEIVCLPDQCEGIIYTISKYAFYNAFEDDSMTFSKDLGRRTYYVFDNRITNIKELYIPSCIATSYSSIFLRAEIFIQTT